MIIMHAKQIEVPQESYLYAWGWEREARDSKSEYCADLVPFSGRHVGQTPRSETQIRYIFGTREH